MIVCILTFCPMNPKMKLEKNEDKVFVIWMDIELVGDVILFKNVSGIIYYLGENIIMWKLQRTMTIVLKTCLNRPVESVGPETGEKSGTISTNFMFISEPE